ncbi:MAG: DHH family phosphoesterase [Desulfosudaceae bacterium]
MSDSKKDRIQKFYARFDKTDQVLIVMNADPDAIAGALAVKRLLWKKAASVTMAHVNVIERPDNISLVNLLGITLIHKDKIDLKEYNRFVMVDSQPEHHEWLARIRPDVIIDHHPTNPPVKKAPDGYADIRPQYGAVSTIMIEYLKAARIIPSKKLATALYLGIKSDTSNFERHARIEDVRAFQSIYKRVNVPLARRIEQADIEPDSLDCFAVALNRRKMVKGWMFTHLGLVNNPDVCVLVADFFMRVNTVKWSVVSGVYENTLVVILRNNGITRDAGKKAKKIFGGMGSAGGHKSMARAEVGLDTFLSVSGAGTDDDTQQWIMDRFLK